MKTLFTCAAVAALAALGGCAAYGDPYATSYPAGVYPASTVYQGVPGYSQYGYGQYGAYPTYPYQGVPATRRERDRDRDHDGIPNRIDRDRDGDGVPNEFDRRPNDPSRR